jgi:hypothetical protein
MSDDAICSISYFPKVPGRTCVFGNGVSDGICVAMHGPQIQQPSLAETKGSQYVPLGQGTSSGEGFTSALSFSSLERSRGLSTVLSRPGCCAHRAVALRWGEPAAFTMAETKSDTSISFIYLAHKARREKWWLVRYTSFLPRGRESVERSHRLERLDAMPWSAVLPLSLLCILGTGIGAPDRAATGVQLA